MVKDYAKTAETEKIVWVNEWRMEITIKLIIIKENWKNKGPTQQ